MSVVITDADAATAIRGLDTAIAELDYRVGREDGHEDCSCAADILEFEAASSRLAAALEKERA